MGCRSTVDGEYISSSKARRLSWTAKWGKKYKQRDSSVRQEPAGKRPAGRPCGGAEALWKRCRVIRRTLTTTPTSVQSLDAGAQAKAEMVRPCPPSRRPRPGWQVTTGTVPDVREAESTKPGDRWTCSRKWTERPAWVAAASGPSRAEAGSSEAGSRAGRAGGFGAGPATSSGAAFGGVHGAEPGGMLQEGFSAGDGTPIPGRE